MKNNHSHLGPKGKADETQTQREEGRTGVGELGHCRQTGDLRPLGAPAARAWAASQRETEEGQLRQHDTYTPPQSCPRAPGAGLGVGSGHILGWTGSARPPLVGRAESGWALERTPKAIYSTLAMAG